MLINKAYLKECFSKQRHYTEKAATDHMDALKRKPGAIAPERLHIYSCRFAIPNQPHWHVGHFKEEVCKDPIIAPSVGLTSTPSLAAIATESATKEPVSA